MEWKKRRQTKRNISDRSEKEEHNYQIDLLQKKWLNGTHQAICKQQEFFQHIRIKCGEKNKKKCLKRERERERSTKETKKGRREERKTKRRKKKRKKDKEKERKKAKQKLTGERG